MANTTGASAWEAEKRHKERRRKIIIIAIILMLILFILLLALIIIFCLQPRERGIRFRVNGHWSDWDKWSRCTRSCGTGTQTRTRECNDPKPRFGGLDCIGPSSESKTCSQWKCPDCYKRCPPGGNLKECSICECKGSLVSGTIRETAQATVLWGVDIYIVGHEWKPRARTNPLGRFNLVDICLQDLSLKLVRDGYQDKIVNATTSTVMYALRKLEKPYFQAHPQDTAAFSGEPVKFTCEASGFPMPHKYEWYKDGTFIKSIKQGNSATNTLEIPHTTEGDSGSYKCQAISTFGKRYSRSASLSVSDQSDTCSSTPVPKIQVLPVSCKLKEDGARFVDVGCCNPHVCKAKAFNVTSSCCGPVRTKLLTIHCEEFTYELTQVLECGCTECQTSGHKYITGLVTLESKPQRARVIFQEQKFFTGYSGKFFIPSVPTSLDRAVLTVEPITSPRIFLPQIKVFDLAHEGETRHVIRLQPIPKAFAVDVSETMTIREGPITVTIPPKVVVNKDEEHKWGTNVYVTYASTQDKESLALASGQFTYENDEGEFRDLETYGVLGISMEDKAGKPLRINDHIKVEVDFNSLGRPEKHGRPDTSLWTLDLSTGAWKEPRPLRYTDSKRRRRASYSSASAKVEIAHRLPYLSFGRPITRERLCTVNVFVYSDRSFSQTIGGDTIRAVTKSNGLFTVSREVSVEQTGRACVTIPCGGHHEISLISPLGDTFPSDNHKLPAKFEYENRINKGVASVKFRSPKMDEVENKDGPIYHELSDTCSEADTSKYHFQFALTLTNFFHLDAVELKPYRSLSWYQNEADNPARRSCFIQLVIETNDFNTQVVAVSRYDKNRDGAGPAYGTFTTSVRQYVDVEMQRPVFNMYTACVQVKCAGTIKDIVSGSVTKDVPTFIDIKFFAANTSSCRPWNVGRFPADPTYGLPSNPATEPLSLVSVSNTGVSYRAHPWAPPLENTFFDRHGFFMASGTRDNSQRNGLRQCLTSNNPAIKFSCLGRRAHTQGYT